MNIKVVLAFIFIIMLAKVLYTDTPLRSTLVHFSHQIVVWIFEKPAIEMKKLQQKSYILRKKKYGD